MPVGLPASFLSQTPLRPDYARWPRRVAVDLIDHAPTYVGLIVFYVGYFKTMVGFARGGLAEPAPLTWTGIGLVLMLVSVGWTIDNRWLLAGRTGQSLGRRLMGVWLVGRQTRSGR